MQVVKWVKQNLLGSAASTTSAVTITLGDRGRQVGVALEPGLPDDAYEQLFHIDLSRVSTGMLIWDHQSRGWHVA